MLVELWDRVAQLFSEEGSVGVLGLCEEEGAVVPRVFASVQEAARMVMEPKWPLAKTAWQIAQVLPDGASLGLVCRGCDMRALIELEKAGQLRPGAVRPIGLNCSAEQAAICRCETPWPPDAPDKEPPAGQSFPASIAGPDRLEVWRAHFSRCVKCYGCRNACPICVCPECKLEEGGYVTKGRVPPDPLAFHLIRAIHLADRCVGCGACQESCPSGLPLLDIHLSMRNALRERTGYVSGTAALSPLLTAGRQVEPLWEDTRAARGDDHA